MSARDERGARMAAVAAELGAAAVLLCGVDGVTYATGYAGAPELGPSPHAGGPNVALVIAPGVGVHDLDAAVRAPIERAGFHDPLHTGHGIGTANFEFPRIVPGERALLEPGMVLMIEPGAYDPTLGGVRLEWMFLVTESGNEILHPYPLHESATV